MDLGHPLRGGRSPACIPSTPPPTPLLNVPAETMLDEQSADCIIDDDPPSDEEQRTFASRSLCDPRGPGHDPEDSSTVEKGEGEGGQGSRPVLARAREVLQQYNPTLTLENAGSVARDHLASERTFLAYVRTSLTIASTGVALVQLFTISAATTNKSLEKYSRPLGAIIIVLGLCTLLFGMVRYFMIQNALLTGNYPVARVSAIMLGLILGAIIVVVFGVIVGVRSH